MRVRGLFFVTVALAAMNLAACGGGDQPPPETPPPPPADTTPPPPPADTAPATPPPADTPPPAPKKQAKEILFVEGNTYMFSLADSDTMSSIKADCGKKNKDQAKADACVQKATDLAATEGVRVEKNKDGKWQWVSFGKDKKGTEVIYTRITFTSTSDDPSKVTLTTQGKDEGKKPIKPLPAAIDVQVPDDLTVVINDAKKGKLVYKKAH